MKKISMQLVRAICAASLERHLGIRAVTKSVPGASLTTVSRIVGKVQLLKKPWSDLKNLSDEELSRLLYSSDEHYLEPDFESMNSQMRFNPKFTLKSAYEEIYLNQPGADGRNVYHYSRFCDLFKNWLKTHTGYSSASAIPCNPGDYLELDFSGDPLRWRDYAGTMHKGHVFVACLRFSKLMYAEVFENETTESWISGAVHALMWLNAKPRAITIDNARALVHKPDPYLGEVSAAVQHLCDYYSMMAQTCPVRRASFKQAVEYSVHLVQKGPQLKLTSPLGFAYAANLKDLNKRLLELVEEANQAPWQQGLSGSRRSCFENRERQCMQPLPPMPYRVCHWTTATASKRYIVKVDHQAWMVDWKEAGKPVRVAIGDTKISFYSSTDFHLVGCYERDFGDYKLHTDPKLMSPADLAFRRGYAGVAEIFKNRGFATDAILSFLRCLFDNEACPQMTKHNIVEGLKNLCGRHGVNLVDSACKWAQSNHCLDDYKRIKSRLFTQIRSISAHERNKQNLKGGK